MRWNLFAKEGLLYAFTFAAGIWAAWFHAFAPGVATLIRPVEFTAESGVVFLIVFIIFTWLLVKMARAGAVVMRVVLALALLIGIQFCISPWLPSPWDIIATLVVLAAFWRVPVVIIHDIAVALGIGGVAAALGASMNPLIAVFLLAVLAVYDIVAVYRSRHMVTLAHRMIQSGAIFGFIIPDRWNQFFWPRREAMIKGNAMMLGSGDIGLPLVLAASSVSTSPGAAIAVGAASLIGLLVTHYLFTHQPARRPMAALPPIATVAIAGYVIAVLFNI